MADLGSDFLGILDIDADFSVGSGTLALAHAVARRLTTTPGQMLDDPSYGYNLLLLTNAAISTSHVAAKIREQCLLEERVTEETEVSVTYDRATQTLTVLIALAIDGEATSYPLTLVLVNGRLTVSDGSTFNAEYLLQAA